MFCAPSRASPQEGIRTTQHHLLTPKGWRARALEAQVLRAGRAQCERVEQNRPVNARGGNGVAQTRAPHAPEAERIAGLCESRAEAFESKGTSNLQPNSLNAR